MKIRNALLCVHGWFFFFLKSNTFKSLVYICTIIFILVCPLLGYILYCTHQRFHPFLISVWSIARCCDAVWGKPCQSRGNSDISVARDYSADLIVVIRIQAPAPPPEMTSPCSFFSRILEVVQNLFLLLTFSLPHNLRHAHLRPQLQTYCHSTSPPPKLLQA